MVDTTEYIESDKERGSGKQLELIEHLAELRSRLARCVLYIAVGTVAGWVFYKQFFFPALAGPVLPYLKSHNGTFLLTGIAEGFTIRMQVSLLVGAILAMPLITMEGWRFISPGLTRQERKGVHLVGPLSVLLFVGGVATAYWILPAGVKWLTDQNPTEAVFMPSVQGTLMFILKMCLAFGLVFQLPVVLMFLAKVGLVDSRMLKSYWRQAVVVLAIVAAVVTPSNDAFSMSMMCLPLIVLYVLSIGLVKLVER